MSRLSRIDIPNAAYYIYTRSNLNYPIFKDNQDYLSFLYDLRKYSGIFGFKMYAYCLLSREFHLLAESTKPNLSEFMQRLLNSFADYFFNRYNIHGKLFSGRFKSYLVEKSNVFLELTRWLHIKPFLDDVVDNPMDYRWSSLAYYLERDEGAGWILSGEVFTYFNIDPAGYLSYMHEEKGEIKKPQIRDRRFIGSAGFVESMENKINASEKKGKNIQKEEVYRIEKIIDIVCKNTDVPPSFFKARHRKDHDYHNALLIVIYIIRETMTWKFREIGEYLGYSTRHVQNLYTQANKNKKIQEKIIEIKKSYSIEDIGGKGASAQYDK